MPDTYKIIKAKCIHCGETIFFLLHRGSSRSCDLLPLCKKCQELYLIDSIKEDKK